MYRKHRLTFWKVIKSLVQFPPAATLCQQSPGRVSVHFSSLFIKYLSDWWQRSCESVLCRLSLYLLARGHSSSKWCHPCIGGLSHHSSYVFLVVYTAEGTPGSAVSYSLIWKSLFGGVQTALPTRRFMFTSSSVFSFVYLLVHLLPICCPVYLCVRLTICLSDYVSVISVEALSDCADVWLSVHPDLSENPFPLF